MYIHVFVSQTENVCVFTHIQHLFTFQLTNFNSKTHTQSNTNTKTHTNTQTPSICASWRVGALSAAFSTGNFCERERERGVDRGEERIAKEMCEHAHKHAHRLNERARERHIQVYKK